MGLTDVIFNILGYVPEFLVWIWGIGWAVTNWQRHPRKSLLTCVSLGVLLFASPAFMTAYALVPRMSSSGTGYQNINGIIRVLSFIHGLVNTAAWALVILALFGKEKAAAPAAQPPVPEGPDEALP